MASGGSGVAPATDSPTGVSKCPLELQPILNQTDPIQSAASEEWLFQLQPSARKFWRWVLYGLLLIVGPSLLIAALYLGFKFYGSETITAIKHVSPSSRHPYPFLDIIPLDSAHIGLIAIGVLLAYLIASLRSIIRQLVRYREIIKYKSDSDEAFHLHVKFEGRQCRLTYATKFEAGLIQRPNVIRLDKAANAGALQNNAITIQNMLPRLRYLQNETGGRPGRLMLRSERCMSKQVYIFKRYLLVEKYSLATYILSIILALIPIVLIMSMANPDFFSLVILVILSLCLLFGIILVSIKFNQILKMSRAWVAVVFDNGSAMLSWKHHLGFPKGYHSDEVFFENTQTLRNLCIILDGLQSAGTKRNQYPFRLSSFSPN